MAKANQGNSELGRVAVMVVLAVVAAGASVWAFSLRSENERLRSRMVFLSAQGGGAAADGETPPTPTPTPTPPTPTAPDAGGAPPGPNRLTDQDRAAMRSKLPATATTENRIWFAVSPDPEAQALAADIQQVFQQAGWNVATRPTTFSVRPGVFFFAAEESPPSTVEDALKALQIVGFAPTVGLGYRAFYEERRRTDPNWRGFELAPDQTFVVVIGPR